MKAHKIITITTIILAIIIISIASVGGIYKLKEYKVVNVVPDYLLGMEFKNSRVANFNVSDEISETKIYDKDGNEVTEKQEGIEYTEENVTSAFSRIMDTDMAEEMTNYTQQNVLSQAAISVLSQANDIPQQVLQLLQ